MLNIHKTYKEKEMYSNFTEMEWQSSLKYHQTNNLIRFDLKVCKSSDKVCKSSDKSMTL